MLVETLLSSLFAGNKQVYSTTAAGLDEIKFVARLALDQESCNLSFCELFSSQDSLGFPKCQAWSR